MKQLLYLSATERQLWGKDERGWQRLSGEPSGHVWLVTDLAEESFAEIKAPRLFGRDRSSYLARQLATRYPDTPYRAFLTPPHGGDLISRLAPTRYILFGVDAAERLNAELDADGISVAGVWPASILLSLLGRDKDLPPDLFIVHPGPGMLRIVFLKNRSPVLTRLTLTANEAGAQIDEIIRTLRHLENTQIVPRGRQTHSVLLLGDPGGFEATMAAVNLKLVSLPRWGATRPDDWYFPLFDLALQSPVGQVAPLVRRTEFLAARLGKVAMALAAVVVIAGIAAAGNNLRTIVGVLGESRRVDASIQQTSGRIAEVEQSIRQFKVAPDTVRRAVALHDDEIGSVPFMETHFSLIASALASDPNLRLTDFQWRLLAPGALPCSETAAPDQTAAGAASPAAGSEKRRVELGMELVLPDTYGPRDRAQSLRTISDRLMRIESLTLWQDATKDLASGSLRGGSALGVSSRLFWCLTLPGITGAAEGLNAASRP